MIIIDHIDYLVRNVANNREAAISDALKSLKRVAEELGLVLIIVSHLRKVDQPGAIITRSKRPNIEDLKGSSSLYQDPEVVILLSEAEDGGGIVVDVQKNKGPMGEKFFTLDPNTGLFSHYTSYNDIWEGTE